MVWGRQDPPIAAVENFGQVQVIVYLPAQASVVGELDYYSRPPILMFEGESHPFAASNHVELGMLPKVAAPQIAGIHASGLLSSATRRVRPNELP
jgi:hypothetical protein